jgi:hypothetical protein
MFIVINTDLVLKCFELFWVYFDYDLLEFSLMLVDVFRLNGVRLYMGILNCSGYGHVGVCDDFWGFQFLV